MSTVTDQKLSASETRRTHQGIGAILTRALGLDVGTRTIGVAISDPTRMLAAPVRTLARAGVAKDVAALLVEIRARDVGHVVVGLPYELDGSESRSARLARQIGDALRDQGLPVTYIDERYTSVEANRALIAADVKRAKRKEVIDQAAAVLILQSWLDHGDWTRDGQAPEEP
jgi:putative Holliday junction resolvase